MDWQDAPLAGTPAAAAAPTSPPKEQGGWQDAPIVASPEAADLPTQESGPGTAKALGSGLLHGVVSGTADLPGNFAYFLDQTLGNLTGRHPYGTGDTGPQPDMMYNALTRATGGALTYEPKTLGEKLIQDAARGAGEMILGPEGLLPRAIGMGIGAGSNLLGDALANATNNLPGSHMVGAVAPSIVSGAAALGSGALSPLLHAIPGIGPMLSGIVHALVRRFTVPNPALRAAQAISGNTDY